MQGIGERIRALRESKGLSQQAVAEALQIKRESINSWENGLRDLKTASIVALADYFDVSTDYLLGRTECQSPDIDVQAICKKTGLSSSAVQRLIGIKNKVSSALSTDDLEDRTFPVWEYAATTALIDFFVCASELRFIAADACMCAASRSSNNCLFVQTLRDGLPPELKEYFVSPKEKGLVHSAAVRERMERIGNFVIDSMERNGIVELMREQGMSDDGETQSS